MITVTASLLPLCPGLDPSADWMTAAWDTPENAAEAHTSWCPCHGEQRPAGMRERIELVTAAAEMTGCDAWECIRCQAIRLGPAPAGSLCDGCRSEPRKTAP